MEGRAVCYGAATIVNAISCGCGGAFGIRTSVVARVLIRDDGSISVRMHGEGDGNPKLAVEAFSIVLRRLGVEDAGGLVETWSDIPVGVGLKSSSAASNAIVLATAAALGERFSDTELITMGVEASRRAGVTITGALDDASASYFGGYTLTDNREMRILKRGRLDEGLRVVVYVPGYRRYTSSVRAELLQRYSNVVRTLHRIAVEGDIWTALILNSLVYSPLLGYDPSIGLEAVGKGALAAGVTGTGPAFVAVCHEEDVGAIVDTWVKLPGDVFVTKVNNEKARVL